MSATFLAWVLVMRFGTSHSAVTPAIVIDNIATVQECERLRTMLENDTRFSSTSRCYQVTKIGAKP